MKKIYKKINQIINRSVYLSKKFYRKFKDGILMGLAAMVIIAFVGLAVAPKGARVYKSEIVQASMQIHELEKGIELWESKIQAAQKQIAFNNKRISLLSQVFNPLR